MKRLFLAAVAALFLSACDDNVPAEGSIVLVHKTRIKDCQVERYQVKAPGRISDYYVTISDCNPPTNLAADSASGKQHPFDGQINMKAQELAKLQHLQALEKEVERLRAELTKK